MRKLFTDLPPHQGAYIHMYYYQIDDYDTARSLHTTAFKLNNKNIPYNISNIGYNICGNSSFDSINKIVLHDPTHTDRTMTLEINANRTKFGISNMLLFLTNCN